MTKSGRLVSVLSIAGSDSGGAAGIQADLKTFAALGVHGLSAVTAITAQNTREIAAAHVLSSKLLIAQLDTLFADFRIGAIKIGMLGNAANIRAITAWLRTHRMRNVVIDPVLVASSGRRLLGRGAWSLLRSELLPLADVLTPNVPEAEALLGREISTYDAMREAAADLCKLGPRAVVLKGGHMGRGKVRDIFIDASTTREISHRRHHFAGRGTGCSLSSAIAAELALGRTSIEAVRRAERYVQASFRRAYAAGRGAQRILGHTPRPRSD